MRFHLKHPLELRSILMLAVCHVSPPVPATGRCRPNSQPSLLAGPLHLWSHNKIFSSASFLKAHFHKVAGEPAALRGLKWLVRSGAAGAEALRDGFSAAATAAELIPTVMHLLLSLSSFVSQSHSSLQASASPKALQLLGCQGCQESSDSSSDSSTSVSRSTNVAVSYTHLTLPTKRIV